MSMPLFRQMPMERQSGFGTRPYPVRSRKEVARNRAGKSVVNANDRDGFDGTRFAVTSQRCSS